MIRMCAFSQNHLTNGGWHLRDVSSIISFQTQNQLTSSATSEPASRSVSLDLLVDVIHVYRFTIYVNLVRVRI